MATIDESKPCIHVELSRHWGQGPRQNRGFEPLRMADEVRLKVERGSVNHIDDLRLDLEADLLAGTMHLPLSFGEPCLVEVSQGCCARGRIEVGRETREQRPCIRLIRFSFDQPLMFRNILSTLREVGQVFKDRDLSALLDRITHLASASGLPLMDSLSRLPFASRLIPLVQTLQKRLEELAVVHLKGFEATPRWIDGAWHLPFRFHGHVEVAGMVNVPFWEIRLPGLVLPMPHASLEGLLSDSPLASADLLRERIPEGPLSEVLVGLLSSFTASFEAIGTLPPVRAHLDAFDGGTMEVNLTLPGVYGLTGKVKGHHEGRSLTLETEGLRLERSGEGLGLHLKAQMDVPGLLRRAGLSPGASPRPGDMAQGELEVEEGSLLREMGVDIFLTHPLAKGEGRLRLNIQDLAMHGALEAGMDGEGRPRWPGALDLNFCGEASLGEGSRLDEGDTTLEPRLEQALFRGQAALDDLAVKLTLDAQARVGGTGSMTVQAIPELSIDDGALQAEMSGQVNCHASIVVAQGEEHDLFDARGSRLDLTLDQARVWLGDRSLALPQGMALSSAVTKGYLTTAGLGELELDLGWDMHGASPLLLSGQEEIALFVDDLRLQSFQLLVSPSGGITIKGKRQGLYDSAYFNALVNPLDEPDKWLDLLENDEAMGVVLDVLRVFLPDLAKHADRVRRHLLKFKRVLDQEGIKQPGDMIPRHSLARVISFLLSGTPDLTVRLIPIIQGVTEAEGLNRAAVANMLEELYPDHEYAFEADRILRWLDHVLSPMPPLPPPRAQERLPLVEDPAHRELVGHLPSAGQIYAVVDGREEAPPGFPGAVAALAPRLTLEQITYILQRVSSHWPSREVIRLREVEEVKRRVRMIEQGYGGVSYVPQGLAVAFFLADVAAMPPDLNVKEAARVERGLLGPEDMAVLLKASLASVTQGRVSQINQRILLNAMAAQPQSLFRDVLVEMGWGSPRIMAGVLFNLLDMSQDRLSHPVDLVELFSGWLGLDLPRRRDFMAGGRWARDSYFQAITRTAEYILDHGAPYLVTKSHLQVHRHPLPGPLPEDQGVRELEEEAQGALAEADELGGRCRFGTRIVGPQVKARRAYQRAFDTCAALLELDGTAFRRPWFKAFWARNHEALVLLSVLRNYQEDIDRVRFWLHTRAGRDTFGGEQNLLEAIIGVLYAHPQDREALKADPLVRLLMDPGAGQYDFTIISAMGVVTKGAQGTELQEAYGRIRERRGIEVIRADTATARTLEFNAKRIEQAIRLARTPWGLVGYSQGCANCLMAEAILLGGTPEQQALLQGLRCRNFLFSAISGSAHGTCSNEKFLRAMGEGEAFLKHYQAVFSLRLSRLFLSGIYKMLYSPFFVHTMGGVESLSHEGVEVLAREGQWLGHVPSSTVRGVVAPEILPEALEFLSNILTVQVAGAPNDTQVILEDAVGYPTRVTNPQVSLLAQCDIPTLAQVTHHWSPLLEDTAFITTERDRERAIYDFPKDRHIFPWIETNARFGIIKVKAGSSEGLQEPSVELQALEVESGV